MTILLNYISYFINDKNEFYTWAPSRKDEDGRLVQIGYPIYKERFMDFIKDAGKSSFLKQDYLDIISRRTPKGANLKDFIDMADEELFYAIFTYFIRGERFRDGLWAKAIDDKVSLKILLKLQLLQGSNT
ncbi:DUF6508 domain-containing protein [Pseudobacteroides cellulosolvens]|uniref:Uncharacterized protein n=1 Tax=Pseudobacteroides cellulosolvens ATCC 35603 = DSM 2933 TaxID=398512 RepID=A0A0L6JME9_9FIRM|nr:DUF6508 domain-containing protein [Pseudobacteroides cellulosolvens]KNY26933.1 hypothetical protein Bccel_2198 [Pseudobacteroides cellulosolvens ATCC 35603 = DSM 2933]